MDGILKMGMKLVQSSGVFSKKPQGLQNEKQIIKPGLLFIYLFHP
jgi:hypothetical protein